MTTQLPMVPGLFLCDDVVREPSTQNVSLIRTFTGLAADQFPWAPHSYTVFASLTDGFGTFTAELRISLLDDPAETVYIVRHPLHFPDRLRTVNYVMRVTQCRFPRAGVYVAALFLDGEWLAQRSLRVYPRA